MLNNIIRVYEFKNKVNFFFSKKNLIYIKGNFGYFVIKIPNYFYLKTNKKIFNFLFNEKSLYIYLLRNINISYNKIMFIYSVRLKLRGLGFKIRKVSKNLYYFFFNYINIFYFYIPKNLLIKWYKKRLLLISNDFFLMKSVFSQILLLKRIGAYKLIGIRFPRQIILIKKGGKKI